MVRVKGSFRTPHARELAFWCKLRATSRLKFAPRFVSFFLSLRFIFDWPKIQGLIVSLVVHPFGCCADIGRPSVVSSQGTFARGVKTVPRAVPWYPEPN